MGRLSVLEWEAEEKVSELEYVSCTELDARSSDRKEAALCEVRCKEPDEEKRDEVSIVLLMTVRDVNTVVDEVTAEEKVCTPPSGMLSY